MNYKISIIIPIHNIEMYLEQTLDSLVNQTIGYENLEVIMIDDCSTDKTPQIIDEYADNYNNFIAVHLTENSGLPGKPRNMGIDMANGEYLMFMDHDDYYSPDAFEVFYNKIKNENADVLFSRYNYVYDNGKIKRNPTQFEENLEEIKINSIDEDERLLNMAPAIWTKIFKRSFILSNKIRFPEGMLGEDLSFMVQSFLKARGIVYLNNYASYNYRIRDSQGDKSTIHIRNKKYLMSMINGYYNTYEILKSENREKYYSIIFGSHLQYWMDSFILSDATISQKKELLKKIRFLFKELESNKPDLNRYYLPLFKNIANGNFDKAISISNQMESLKTNGKIQKHAFRLKTISYKLNYKIKNIFNK